MIETAAFVCSHIFGKTRPVLLVSREGADWQFLCGETHGENEKPRVICLNHLICDNPTLREVADLPENSEAERDAVGDIWRRMPITL